jgi:hypothetical protein
MFDKKDLITLLKATMYLFNDIAFDSRDDEIIKIREDIQKKLDKELEKYLNNVL